MGQKKKKGSQASPWISAVSLTWKIINTVVKTVAHIWYIKPFTANFSQKQILTKSPNFILWNFEKQTAPCESTGRELSFEWSHHRILSADSKVGVTLQNSIKQSGSERDKNLTWLWGFRVIFLYIIWFGFLCA